MANCHPVKRGQCWWWGPDLSTPNCVIRLENLCYHALTKHLTTVIDEAGRDSRKKKALRDHFSNHLPVALQSQLIEKAASNVEEPETILNLLYILQPFQKSVRDSIDFVGNLRYAIDLEITNVVQSSQSRWQPFFPLTGLTSAQLNQLYNILICSKSELSELKSISIATQRNALKESNFPNILARAHSLTRVVILQGADNHALRILGLNCPLLKHLDVSHSSEVDDTGLQNLLLKQLPHRRTLAVAKRISTGRLTKITVDHLSDHRNTPKNPSAAMLECIILTETGVTWEGCDFACKIMGEISYLHALRPLVKITRIKNFVIAPTSTRNGNANNRNHPFQDALDVVQTVKETMLEFAQNGTFTLVGDIFEHTDAIIGNSTAAQSRGENNGHRRILEVFIRRKGTFYAMLAFRMEGAQVTSLSLPSYSLNWELMDPEWDTCFPLDILGNSFPNLVRLNGCLKGTWNIPHENYRRLPRLQKAHVWARNSTTAVSLLRHCSSLKYFEYNHLDIFENAEVGQELKLTDNTIRLCFQDNPGLSENLEEMYLRPARNLTYESINLIFKTCNKLVHLGDFHCWNSDWRIDEESFVKRLKSNAHNYVPRLSLFNTPTSEQMAKDWDSLIPF